MMKKEVTIGIIFGIVFLFFSSLYLDKIIISSVEELRSEGLNGFFLIITYISSKVVFFIFLTSLFLWKEHKRRWIAPLWLSLIGSGVIAFILKFSIQRLRPFQQGLIQTLPSLIEKSYFNWNFSLPSSHSMLAFCVIPILNEQFPKFKKVWIIFALIVSFSRVYLGLHFLSDIIAGAAIGYLVGLIIVKTEKETKFGKRIYDKFMRR